MKELEKELEKSKTIAITDSTRPSILTENDQSTLVLPRSDPETTLGMSLFLNAAGSSGGTEDDASTMDAMVDSAQSPLFHESEDALDRSSTLHFAMNVEASVACDRSSRLNPKYTAESRSVPGTPSNPWQKGDPRRKDALPKPGYRNKRNQISTAYVSSSSESLPKHHVAQLLFERYFSIVNPIWPFLLEDECSDLLSRTWESQEPLDPICVAQLNLIFCLSCRSYNDNLDEKSPFEDTSRASFEFYSRAREYVVLNSFDLANMRMLQTLLLMAQYQQSTLRSRQCYLTIGHAARMAQELGLHIPLPESPFLSPLNRELRLRLWWGCFSLDR